MPSEIGSASVKITAETEAFKRDLEKARQLLASLGEETKKVRKNTDSMNASLKGMETGLKSLTGALAGYVTVQTAVKAVRMADEFNQLQARIKLATEATGDYNKVSSQLIETSKKTGASFEGTVGSFQRLQIGAKEMGKSNADVLRLVETVQKLGAVGGASTQSMNAGMMQFSQGMTSNVLRAEEFNSIQENMPFVLTQIAEGLGVSSGHLRRMVIEGKLLSKDVFEALLRQSEKADTMFSKLPANLERSTNKLQLASSEFLSNMDKSLGVVNKIAFALEKIADLVDDAAKGAKQPITHEVGALQNSGAIPAWSSMLLRFGLNNALGPLAGGKLENLNHQFNDPLQIFDRPGIKKTKAPPGVGAGLGKIYSGPSIPYEHLYFSTKENKVTEDMARTLADVDRVLEEMGAKFKLQISSTLAGSGHSDGRGGEHKSGKYFDVGLSNLTSSQKIQAYQALASVGMIDSIGSSGLAGMPKIRSLKNHPLSGPNGHFHVGMLDPKLAALAGRGGTNYKKPSDNAMELYNFQRGMDTNLGFDLQGSLLKGLSAANQGIDSQGDYQLQRFKSYKSEIESLKTPMQGLLDDFEKFDSLNKQFGGTDENKMEQETEFVKKLAEAYPELTENIANTMPGYQQFKQDLSESNSLTDRQLKLLDQIHGPAEAYKQTIEDLTELLNIGKISQSEYNQAVKDAKDAFESTRNHGKSAMDDIRNAVERMGLEFEDTFIRMAQTGKFEFGELVSSILTDIARLTLRQTVINPFVGFVTKALTGAFGGGGGAGAEAAIALRSAVPLPGRAFGGPVSKGRPYWVGERGKPEVFIPDSNGYIDASGHAGGGGEQVVQNFNFSMGVAEAAKQEIYKALPMIMQAAKQGILSDAKRGGQTAAVMGLKS